MTTRKEREEQATQAITQVAGITDQATQTAIAREINHLYSKWSNSFQQDNKAQITQQLERLGITVSVEHYSGDSSFPTEYVIQHAKIHAVGPTFDLALVEFIDKLLSLTAL